MATTTARTKQDVDSMSRKDRIWDSLNYSYGLKRESSDKAYDKAYSQADRQALRRGMQRSSYNAQNLANIDQRKIEAQNNIWDAQIADYENRLDAIEQQEAAADQWERQFAENQRQYNESLAYNRERAAASDAQWQQQFGYQKERDTVADTQWQQQYDEQRRQFEANMAYQRERANVSDAQWQQQYDESLRQFNTQFAENQRQYDENLAYNRERAAASDAQWQQQYEASRADTAWNQAFQQSQADENVRQFNENLAYNREQAAISNELNRASLNETIRANDMRYGTEGQYAQSLAVSWAQSMLANGQMPSDDLLAKAGLSKADAEKMISQASSSSSGGGTVADWKKQGFPDYETANVARALGYNSYDAYRSYLNGQSSSAPQSMDALVAAYNAQYANQLQGGNDDKKKTSSGKGQAGRTGTGTANWANLVN